MTWPSGALTSDRPEVHSPKLSYNWQQGIIKQAAYAVIVTALRPFRSFIWQICKVVSPNYTPQSQLQSQFVLRHRLYLIDVLNNAKLRTRCSTSTATRMVCTHIRQTFWFGWTQPRRCEYVTNSTCPSVAIH